MPWLGVKDAICGFEKSGGRLGVGLAKYVGLGGNILGGGGRFLVEKGGIILGMSVSVVVGGWGGKFVFVLVR